MKRWRWMLLLSVGALAGCGPTGGYVVDNGPYYRPGAYWRRPYGGPPPYPYPYGRPYPGPVYGRPYGGPPPYGRPPMGPPPDRTYGGRPDFPRPDMSPPTNPGGPTYGARPGPGSGPPPFGRPTTGGPGFGDGVRRAPSGSMSDQR
jgi:peptidoglycan glycosyltransferase